VIQSEKHPAQDSRQCAALPNDLVSVPEAAAIARINPRTIWKKIRSGDLTAYGPRKCYRVSISELLAPVVVVPNNKEGRP
jgi:hypothetical protein